MKKGSLIQFALDNIKKESFEVIRRELYGVLKHRAAVYALYKKDKLVRVGLGTNVFWRLWSHSRNEKLDWDTASLFVVKNIKYLRDLETAIIRIAKPKYNDQKGRVRDEKFLPDLLKHSINEKRKKLRKEKMTKDMEIKDLARDIAKIEKVIGGKRYTMVKRR